MTTEDTAAALVRTVTAIPGVRGIEPGIASALRILDAHLRGQDGQVARFGIVVDDAQRTTIEVGLDGSRPIRQVVRDIQAAVMQALHQPEESNEPGDPEAGSRTGEGADGATSRTVDHDASREGAEPPHAGGVGGQELQSGADAQPRPSVTVRVQSLSA
ncbi:transcriptional regulator [Actinomyces bowdenii]|uniref:transcriptional regulator n=1 Tax=Actinomyces bowdenii TaxID=131109 RepID=UPI00214C1C91|nr:transcriptional regulator [Actinomyces bowdenii]MCR2053531.1 transcriptional regulator [Actinomyces bowdenii]